MSGRNPVGFHPRRRVGQGLGIFHDALHGLPLKRAAGGAIAGRNPVGLRPRRRVGQGVGMFHDARNGLLRTRLLLLKLFFLRLFRAALSQKV